ncbi:MAG: site-specific DNA-methyltransferase, partial [Lentisphaerae bacterium]|nr:site-specific DNA-methyltransferase [Lentisphaerota bacterium]
LDSFAGSGTTGHAVLKLNHRLECALNFILVELDEGIAASLTYERLQKAVDGYTPITRSGNAGAISSLGGGFRFCRIGTPLFDAEGNISGEVRFGDLARHVYFCETGEPLPKQNGGKTPLLGIHNGTAIYLLYNGILGDKTPDGGNVLTRSVLADLPLHNGSKVIYGTSCRLSEARLQRENIVFRQIPYEVKVK